MSFQQSGFGDTGDLLCLAVVYFACTLTCELHCFLFDLQLSVHYPECDFREVLADIREVFRFKIHVVSSGVCSLYDVIAIECEVILCVLIIIDTYIIALHCLLGPVVLVLAAVLGDSHDDFVSVRSDRKFARCLCHFVVLRDIIALRVFDHHISAECAVISSDILTLCGIFQSGVIVSFQQSGFGDTGDLLCLAVVYFACTLTCECKCFFLNDQFTLNDLYFYSVSNVFAVFCDLYSSACNSLITAGFYICAGGRCCDA